MRTLRSLIGVAVLLVLTALGSAGQVIPGPEGPVEFIGLRQWDAQELFEAIRGLDPDLPFHACAVVMKDQLGFADAAAISYRTRGADGEYTIVVGVEDSERVRYRPTGIETVVLPEIWQQLKAAVDEDVRTVTAAAATLHSRDGAPAAAFGEVWDLVDRADSEEDRILAHEVLARDSSASARAVATLVLGNFVDDETSWHGLVGSLIDSEGRVSTVAESVLSGLTRQDVDPVGWSGARTTLSAIFDGTNPFAFNDTLRLLMATGIDAEFGQQLVRESPDLLLAHLGAEHEFSRAVALAFLKAVSGEDFGVDVAAWTAWIDVSMNATSPSGPRAVGISAPPAG